MGQLMLHANPRGHHLKQSWKLSEVQQRCLDRIQNRLTCYHRDLELFVERGAPNEDSWRHRVEWETKNLQEAIREVSEIEVTRYRVRTELVSQVGDPGYRVRVCLDLDWVESKGVEKSSRMLVEPYWPSRAELSMSAPRQVVKHTSIFVDDPGLLGAGGADSLEEALAHARMVEEHWNRDLAGQTGMVER